MASYRLPLVVLFREHLRSAVRQILLYIFACTCMVMAFSGWLEPAYLSTHPFLNIFVTALVIGTPLGIVAYFLLRLLRFAFGR